MVTKRTPQPRRLTSPPAFTVGALLACLLMLLSGCVRPGPTDTSAPPQPEMEHHLPVQDPAAPPFDACRPIHETIVRMEREQYSPPATVYTPPGQPLAASLVTRIAPQRRSVTLAKGVATFTGGMDGLALALESGILAVSNQCGCPSLVAPGGTPPAFLFHLTGSPMLAMVPEDRKSIHTFDLRTCGGLAVTPATARLENAAVSRDGMRIAAVDEVRNLLLGSIGGPLKSISKLRYPNLALAFTPRGGVLIAVDAQGFITNWDAETGKRMQTDRVAGGPFRSADFHRETLRLTDANGRVATWNLPRREQTAAEATASGFALADGVLSFTGRDKVPTKSVMLFAPRMRCELDAEMTTVRIRDIDGRERYYDAATGLPAQTPASEMGLWTELDPAEDWSLDVNGETLRLADPVHVQDGLVLFSRHIPETGFYVWWERDPGLSGVPQRAPLPVRAGIETGPPASTFALE